ncbi:hypothetical protein [Blastomonas fulva]|uniref:Uncharacterized protein n=1 Tax=Blastomonas fulva TaxID=1550728 RepID=A0ABN5BD99_9SPHN|nr:hypothetical protein [Blastomonas fulva]ASR53710.1 hypothetical protein B5J99_18935 [Blastomonas fulva]
MFSIDDVDALWDHIGYVALYAPDEFPEEDFLAADQQMNLERAFEMLRQGLTIAYPESSFFERKLKLNDILDQSYEAYKAGDGDLGSKLLHVFQDGIFKAE